MDLLLYVQSNINKLLLLSFCIITDVYNYYGNMLIDLV